MRTFSPIEPSGMGPQKPIGQSGPQESRKPGLIGGKQVSKQKSSEAQQFAAQNLPKNIKNPEGHAPSRHYSKAQGREQDPASLENNDYMSRIESTMKQFRALSPDKLEIPPAPKAIPAIPKSPDAVKPKSKKSDAPEAERSQSEPKIESNPSGHKPSRHFKKP